MRVGPGGPAREDYRQCVIVVRAPEDVASPPVVPVWLNLSHGSNRVVEPGLGHELKGESCAPKSVMDLRREGFQGPLHDADVVDVSVDVQVVIPHGERPRVVGALRAGKIGPVVGPGGRTIRKLDVAKGPGGRAGRRFSRSKTSQALEARRAGAPSARSTNSRVA